MVRAHRIPRKEGRVSGPLIAYVPTTTVPDSTRDWRQLVFSTLPRHYTAAEKLHFKTAAPREKERIQKSLLWRYFRRYYAPVDRWLLEELYRSQRHSWAWSGERKAHLQHCARQVFGNLRYDRILRQVLRSREIRPQWMPRPDRLHRMPERACEPRGKQSI